MGTRLTNADESRDRRLADLEKRVHDLEQRLGVALLAIDAMESLLEAREQGECRCEPS